MKILIVHPNTPIFGGAETVIYEFARYLKAKGHEGLFISTGERNLLATRLQGIIPSAIAVNYSPYIGKLGEIMALWQMVKYYSKDYDVVFAHNFPSTLACKGINKPVVWQCNEPPELFTSFLRKPIEAFNRYLVRSQIKNVIVADKANADRFEKLYRVKPHIIPYGVDYEFWSQTPERVTDGYFNVVQIGTITPYKNQMASVEAVAELVKDIPNIRLILVGEASGKYYKSLVLKTELIPFMNGRIVFTGHVSREQVRSFLGQADVVIHPVRNQGGWLVPFEAMAAGKDVIVSREFTASDLINNEGLGVVTTEYADAIRVLHIIDSPFNKSQAYVRDNLSWEQYGDKVIEVFNAAVRGPARLGEAGLG